MGEPFLPHSRPRDGPCPCHQLRTLFSTHLCPQQFSAAHTEQRQEATREPGVGRRARSTGAQPKVRKRSTRPLHAASHPQGEDTDTTSTVIALSAYPPKSRLPLRPTAVLFVLAVANAVLVVSRHWRAPRLGPEVGRMQAREKNREFTACDKCYGEIQGSGKTRANQERSGASNERATQGDADGSRHALQISAEVKGMRESTSRLRLTFKCGS